MPNTTEAGKASARGAAETQYRHFAQHLGVQFTGGHRFVDDVPIEVLGGDDGDK